MLCLSAKTGEQFDGSASEIINFRRLMSLYIAVFFVVSQLMSAALFGERPSPSLLVGGALIVAGGLVIQLGQ